MERFGKSASEIEGLTDYLVHVEVAICRQPSEKGYARLLLGKRSIPSQEL
jgi:hypothetical protein